jgi:hypothetical protein
MSARGLEYLGGAFPWAVNYEQAQYVYGGTSIESATANGLRSAIWMESERALAEGRDEPGQDYAAALEGSPSVTVADSNDVEVATYDPDSCLGLALDSVTPKWADFEAARQMSGEVLLAVGETVESSPEVVAGFVDWSQCMGEAGYDYPDPWSMAADFPGKLPTAAEIAVAEASAECMHSSGLLRTWSKAQAQHVSRVLRDEHSGLLDTWDRLVEETLAGIGNAG